MPAADVYEITLQNTAVPRDQSAALLRRAFLFIAGLLTMGDRPGNEGGMIVSVVHKESGAELFRHIEDDDGHLLHEIEQDLASMTANEFKATWG